MAITSGDYIQYQRWDQFTFYEASIALNSVSGINTYIGFSVLWKFEQLRLHFSTAVISDLTMAVRLSSARASSLNARLLSQQLSNAQDLILDYTSNALLFCSNEQLLITTSTLSVTNLVGIEVVGWAVRG